MSSRNQPSPADTPLPSAAGILALVVVVGSLLPVALLVADVLMRAAVAGVQP